jgi:hypothetical protein
MFTTKARYFVVLVTAGVLYAVSCAPGPLWQDSGLIQYRTWHSDIEGPLGLALSHPLFYIVTIAAKHVPLGSFAHRVNLVAAIAAAFAVANLYLLIRLWLGRDLPAIVAAMTLAFSHTFWQHAAMVETYTLWTALFLAEMISLLQYERTRNVHYLYALGLLNGLAVSVHTLASIPLACYIVLAVVLLVRKSLHIQDIGTILFLWILGALPFEYLIVKDMIHSGDIMGTLASAAFGDRWKADVLNVHLSWHIVKENGLFLLLNFPTPNAAMFFVSVFALCRAGFGSIFHRIVAALAVLFFVFAFRYTVSDRYAFFIPFYTMACVVIGLGVQAIQDRIERKILAPILIGFALLPVGVYAVAPMLARQMNVKLGTRADIAYRDDYEFFLRPWKTGYHGAQRFAREALDGVEADAAIFADTTTVGPLLYVQEVEKLRGDVKIVTGVVRSKGVSPYSEQTMKELLQRGPVYVTSDKSGYCPVFVLREYELVKCGLLWRVEDSVCTHARHVGE